jgi:hypothetical protein
VVCLTNAANSCVLRFDPAELIEDFEHPICTSCLGVGWVRDANGIEMIRCEGCEGVGRAPSY